MDTRRLLRGIALLALVALVAAGLWQTRGAAPRRLAAVTRRPQAVMGTACTLAVAVEPGDPRVAEAALREAEAELRAVEARMSVWLTESEVSRLNASPAGEEVMLSPQTLEVLSVAREAARQTEGAFDITCRPLIALWREAGERNRLPTDSQLRGARAASRWDLLEVTARGAIKHGEAVQVDLGGIAKGYGIDRAVAALARAPVLGGMVDVGGDVRCFGRPPNGRYWPVDIKDPFGEGVLAQMQVRDGAVCTSGSYARFTVIEGERYSHIIDPRTGRPAEAVPSVTVLAADAMTADVWATALSVLAEDGLPRLPEGVEALLVVAPKRARKLVCTPGLRDVLREPLPEGLVTWEPEAPTAP